MKIALLADTHFGVRNDTIAFYDSMESFYNNTFFPTLQQRRIKKVLHFGDVFDRRKYGNFQTMEKARSMFFEPLYANQIQMEVILGNHDVYFRSTNRLTAVEEILGRWDNIKLHKDPCRTNVFGMDALLLPWINSENFDRAMDLIKETPGMVPVFGHLEISGFHMYRHNVCDHGLDPKIFNKFEHVLTGHFHHGSKNGPVRYLGAPYEMIWADFDDPRGFWILDTEYMEMEYIRNPDRMFYRVKYDDSTEIPGNSRPGPDVAPSPEWKGKYIKITVMRKKDPYAFDQFMDSVWATQPFDVTVIEDESLDIDKVLEGKDETLIIDDTPTVLKAYVDAVNVEINKSALNRMMLELYTEAVALAGKD